MQPAKSTLPPRHLSAGFHTRNSLPHFKREGASYFVTFRLAGTLPRELIQQFKAERDATIRHALAAKRPLTWNEQEDLFRWYSKRVDAFLDAGHGDCFLKQPAVADLVATALKFFDSERYDLGSWVIMPNHVHVVLRPKPPHTLSEILQSWKSFTSKEANRMLRRSGPFWQRESYDHLIRDEDDLARCCKYTTANPVNGRLCERPEQWRWSSLFGG